MKLNLFKRRKTIEVEANPSETPVPDLLEIADDMRQVGRPLLRGEGKMSRQLVPIQIIIELKPDGQHLYPNFNTLASVQASGMDWSRYVDVQGSGWHYDSCCGHKTDTLESPFGEWRGMLIVPKAFADDAIAAFSSVVSKQTEPEAQAFYDDHVAKDLTEQEIDPDVLTAIKLHRDLGRSDEPWMVRALDPTNDERGIRNNKRKHWVDYKALTGVVIIQ